MSSPGEGPDDAIAFGQRLLSLLDTGSFTTTYKYATLLAIIDETLARVGAEGQPPRRLRVARNQHPDRIAVLQQEVTDTVGRYPVPLLQRFGPGKAAEEDRFVYGYDWSPGSIPGPDAEIIFVEKAPGHLVTLAGLLRPLIHREWARFVASRNQLREESIEEFLFGARRRSLQALRAPLRDFYEGRCFYCANEPRGSLEIDHFLPWVWVASGTSSSPRPETSWTSQPSTGAPTSNLPSEHRTGADQPAPPLLPPRRL